MYVISSGRLRQDLPEWRHGGGVIGRPPEPLGSAMNATITSDRSLREHAYVFRASYAQRSLWFLDQLSPGSSLYNLHTGMRFRSALDVTVLEQSISEIVRRHESLRTSFKAVNGRSEERRVG